ncbi:hypothetical protein MPDQ_000045 [Monascus purpureus]|uniref:Uncharacterized protein n=1 Tax=Monascus purpureus TaxID=5098 RepID=A0A507R7K1_MONPU|nr:hypothetical protein MPDQ_000045 [Monascus purpureus]
MMMVPRAFLFSSVTPPKASRQHGKNNAGDSPKSTFEPPSQRDTSGLQIPPMHSSDVDEKATLHSNPVVIPPKRGLRVTPVHQGQQEQQGRSRSRTAHNSRNLRRSSSTATLPASVASILEATAIPVPRRNWSLRDSRKLPRGNYVEDFSKLLMEGVDPKEDRLMDGSASPMLDVLLSPPDADSEKLSIGNDDYADATFSLRSMSTDSMPSLMPDVESPSSFQLSPTPSTQRGLSERRHRQLARPEDCASDHPLLQVESPEHDEFEPIRRDIALPSAGSTKSTSSRSFPRFSAGLKSNLTASLRAIKSAAQTVSTFAAPSVQPDDFLTRSLFAITPETTDDRRPPPMSGPPSPALRRYLNPTPISPAEMHTYHEYPRGPSGSPSMCPVSIQMQTYHRSASRLRKNGSTDQGISLFDPGIIPPMARQREPRENGDFLRMVVLEMNMRRSGKFRDDIPIRARIWLPPRKASANPSCGDYTDDEGNTVPARWVGISIDCR